MKARVCGALSLLLGTSAAFAEEAAFPLLELMARNVRGTNYHGIFTYQEGQRTSSARIVHTVVDGVEQERLQDLDGAGREFLRMQHPLDCEHAGHRLLSSPAAAASLSNPGIAQFYAVEMDGTERIASREGRRLRISPRDPYRYGMTLVLDVDSGLPLKAETTDGAGRVLERVQFVELVVGGASPAAEMSIATPGERIDTSHAVSRDDEAGRFSWSVSWLPAGFAESARERRQGDSGREVETRMFTDGLAVFSVFVEHQSDADVTGPGQAAQGATVAYVTPRLPEGVVTVVGEIPPETARLVANAVSFAAP